MSDWPFDQEPNVAATTTRQVIEDKLPILNVVHHEDDHSWAFLCGTSDETEDGRLISMEEALAIDKTLSSIAHLQPGQIATREAVGSEWSVSKASA
jgi:hypothetical protein